VSTEEAHQRTVRDAAEKSLRRWSLIERLLALVIALGIVAALVTSTVSISLEYANRRDRQRADCVARIQGVVLGDAFAALAAPPSPSTARAEAVATGLADVAKLQHIDRYC
jgi:hypothetical protein